ncbi:MAG: ComEC/Rec2 family competence protein [Rikenellaceae bacterium]
MVVVAFLFLVVVASLAKHLRETPPSQESLFLILLDSPNRASITSIYDGERWQSSTLDILYGCKPPLELQPGDKIICRGEIQTLGDQYYLHLRAESVVERIQSTPTLQYRLNDTTLKRLQKLSLSPESEAIVSTMLLSRKESIPPQLLANYRRVGAAHLLAVSGLHVSIVTLVVMLLLTPLTLIFRGYVIRAILTVILLWLYANLNFLSPSVERATIMQSMFLLGCLFLRQYNSMAVLSTAIVIMAIIDPMILFDVGFQLSVVSVLSIILWVVPLWRARPTYLRHFTISILLLPILLSLCCTIATLPIVSHNFGYQPFAGILIAPLLNITSFLILMLAIIWLIFGVLPIEWFLAPSLELCVRLQNSAISLVAERTPPTEITISKTALILIYILYAATTIYLHNTPHREKLLGKH